MFRKRRLFVGSFIAFLSILTIFSVGSSHAAIVTYYDDTGTPQTISTDGDNSHFTFTSPFEIKDNVTQLRYHTTATACGSGEHMYICTGSGNSYHSDNYWYWPDSDGKSMEGNVGPTGSKACASALVLEIPVTSHGLRNAHLSVVNQQAGTGVGCQILNYSTGKPASANDIEGTGLQAVEDSNVSGGSDLIDPSEVVVKHVEKQDQTDRAMFAGLATFFAWAPNQNGNEIDSIPNAVASTKVTVGSTEYQDIQSGFALSSTAQTAQAYAKGYDYFVTPACIVNTHIEAFLAVQQGDNTTATIIHRINGDTSTPGGFKDDFFPHDSSKQGGQLACLWKGGGNGMIDSPARLWSGPPTDSQMGIADIDALTTNISTVGGNTGSGLGSTKSPSLNCSATFYNPLTWLMCPIATGFVSLATSFDSLINGLLCVQPDTTVQTDVGGATIGAAGGCTQTGTGTGSNLGAFKPAWAAMRDISLGLIVVTGLIAIISQTTNFGMMDAYTIKKALPRVLIASILVSLSWPLLNWFIQLTNDLGYGVRQLIYAPFGSAKLELGSGTTLIGALLSTGVVFGFGIVGLLSFGATALLATAVALVVLIFRQIAMTALVIFAPIALMCYVLPNTKKVADFWWDGFKGLSLMFVIISAIIAVAHIIGATATKSGSPIVQLIGLFTYMGGYLALSKVGQFTGVVGRALTGGMQNATSGIFGGLKKGRSARFKDRVQRMRQGGLYSQGAGKIGFGEDSRFKNFIPKSLRSKVLGKQFSLANVANYASQRMYDGDEVVGSFIGKHFGLGLSNYAKRSDAFRAEARMHQTAKAAQEVFGNSSWQAALLSGGRFLEEDLGLSEASKSALAARGFLKATQNADGTTSYSYGGRKAGQYQVPEYNAIADIIGQNEKDNNVLLGAAPEVRQAGAMLQNLRAKGELNRIGGFQDFVALTAAATSGRLSGRELARSVNGLHDEGLDNLATEMHGLLVKASGQKRSDLDTGYGIMQREVEHDGKKHMEAYYVFEDPKSNAAIRDLVRMDTSQLTNLKGDAWKEGADQTALYILSDEYTTKDLKGGTLDKETARLRKAEQAAFKAKLTTVAGGWGHGGSDAQAKLMVKLGIDPNSPNNQPVPDAIKTGGPDPGGGAPDLTGMGDPGSK